MFQEKKVSVQISKKNTQSRPQKIILATNRRPRARDIGIEVGIYKPGQWNAITDVKGVLVGHETVWKGRKIRSGVTVVIPHEGNLFQNKVEAAVYIYNGFGKMTGIGQIEEVGNIETPIALTDTCNVPVVADSIVEYILKLPGNEAVTSVNPVVGDTNMSFLNDSRSRPVKRSHLFKAIKNSCSGPVDEGVVGAGTGTSTFGWKGGIGTSSRILPEKDGFYTVGILVQTNFGGILTINGAPVGRELNCFSFSQDIPYYTDIDGSCMIIVATDAPLCTHNLKRLAKRAILGMARTGAISSHKSGDFVIAFSTTNRKCDIPNCITQELRLLSNEAMNPLFTAIQEATEEAIYNAILKAVTVVGLDGRKREAIDVEKVKKILEKYNMLDLHSKILPWKSEK
jgi:D-aminopeptidase